MAVDVVSGNVDKYALFAQAVPALLAAAPLGVAVAACFPKDLTALGILGGLLVTCGASVPLAQFARSCGKQIVRDGLFDAVGGQPTTRFLRHCNDRLNSQTRRRYHAKLSQLVGDTPLPTPDEEENDGAVADASYGSCVDLLREQTRDAAQFPVVYAANINYGFRRNSLGIRRLGRIASGIGLAACLLRLLMHARAELVSLALAGAFVDALFLYFWHALVTPVWVHEAADDYAVRLLASCDKIAPPPAPPAAPVP